MDISKTGADAARAANLESALSRAGEAGGIGVTTAAFQKAETRAQQPKSVTSVQISAPGQIKSSLAELQTASRALVADAAKSPSNEELKSATTKFVSALNKVNQTARQTTTEKIAQKALEADATQGPTEGQRTRAAEVDRGRKIESDKPIPIEVSAIVAALNVNAPLQQIGITTQADGKLAIDSRKLDAALQIDPVATRSVLVRAAESVNGAVSRELSSTGSNTSAATTSSDRDRSTESRQTAQLAQAATAEQTRLERAKDLSNTQIAGGIDAYQRVFTG